MRVTLTLVLPDGMSPSEVAKVVEPVIDSTPVESFTLAIKGDYPGAPINGHRKGSRVRDRSVRVRADH